MVVFQQACWTEVDQSTGPQCLLPDPKAYSPHSWWNSNRMAVSLCERRGFCGPERKIVGLDAERASQERSCLTFSGE